MADLSSDTTTHENSVSIRASFSVHGEQGHLIGKRGKASDAIEIYALSIASYVSRSVNRSSALHREGGKLACIITIKQPLMK
jgi:hypothetical protein